MDLKPPADLQDGRKPDAIKFDARTADRYADKGTVLHFAMRLGFYVNTEEEAEVLLHRLILEREYYETFIHLHYHGQTTYRYSLY